MKASTGNIIAALLLACALGPGNSFGVSSRVHSGRSSTQLGIFGGLKKAFDNDDSLGAAENAGLKGGPIYNEVTINGKPVKAVVGQKVSQVAAGARVKITYSCKKGDCGTCTINMNGRMVKACQEKIPNGKCSISTLS